MRHSIQALGLIEQLKRVLKNKGLRDGRAFRRHCARLYNDAAYRDLQDIRSKLEFTGKLVPFDKDED